MQRTVFYSWQADLPNPTNRGFIQDTLERAIYTLRRTETLSVAPAIDRDTSGYTGSPSITESIFAKISCADVLIADVSIVNMGSEGRQMPNPNVLIELGYAIPLLRWDRIILVQNINFGGPEKLPFDLRGRKILTYSLAKNEDKVQARGILKSKIEAELKGIFDDATSFTYAGKHAGLWWGKWNIDTDSQNYGGHLFIKEVCSIGFLFNLTVYSGAHTGEISGRARFMGANLAYARFENELLGGLCEVSFRREFDNGKRIIMLQETGDCSYHRGMGAVFAGRFIHRGNILFDIGFLDEMDLSRLHSLLGSKYDDFMECFGGVTSVDNLDQFPASVMSGGVRGLYTIMEGILMKGGFGELWAAYIDDDVVRYFTTEEGSLRQIPKTVNHWRERFEHKSVIFSGVERFVDVDERSSDGFMASMRRILGRLKP